MTVNFRAFGALRRFCRADPCAIAAIQRIIQAIRAFLRRPMGDPHVKHLLLGSSALVGAVAAAMPAVAEEPIRLSVGGYFKSAYMVVIDQDEEGEPGNGTNTDGFFSDSEIHFTGSTVLDNGLEVGARVELEGETDEDQIDEAWIWFSGGFGEVRIGSDDDALANSCIVPPGGTANFSAFSANQWGGNFNFLGSNTVCTGVDDESDAQKILYITPNFHGFQLTASYTPNPDAETHINGGGPHLGMPASDPDVADADLSAYLTNTYEGEGWGLTWGGGGSWEVNLDGPPDAGPLEVDANEQDFYQTGLTLTIGQFAFGAAFEYQNDISNIDAAPLFTQELDKWVAGGGIAYTHDAWVFGLQYSYSDADLSVDAPALVASDGFELVHQRVVATANYALGPGIQIDGEIGYTWSDIDPEVSLVGVDPDYDGLEFGIGTSLAF
jgi:predicted porin